MKGVIIALCLFCTCGMLNAQNAVILVGYVDYSLIYIQPETGERLVTSTRQMDEMTSGSGNTYVG